MNISICAPSYKRPLVETFEYIPYIKVFVDEGEYQDYIKRNPKHKENIVSVPKGIQGNLCRIRNYILDVEFAAGADVVLILDDDLKGLYYYDGDKENAYDEHLVPANNLLQFVEKYSSLCREFGFKMWGVNCNSDPMCYRHNTPFSTTAYLGGPFQAFLKNPLRYDERLPLKEDYDMTLQQCNKYRGVLRVNKYHYKCKQSKQAGGCATIRNFDKEAEQLKLLQRKWGTKIVKIDARVWQCEKEKKNIDYNPIIKVPIPGV